MITRRMHYLFWFSALAIIVACVPSIGTAVPTVDPNQVNVFIAQTANAARTQTAAAMPTSTATAIPTQTPANTFTPSPTFTSTVIFVLASPTVPVTATSTFFLGGGGTSADDFACQVLSVSPPNGTTFDGRTDFDAVWRVKNIGQRNWNRTAIDYTYDSGAQMHKVAGYDLSADVRAGATTDITVDMVAPRNSGNYTTTWTLRRSNIEFCRMTLTINVR
jgi:hypothetical protein